LNVRTRAHVPRACFAPVSSVSCVFQGSLCPRATPLTSRMSQGPPPRSASFRNFHNGILRPYCFFLRPFHGRLCSWTILVSAFSPFLQILVDVSWCPFWCFWSGGTLTLSFLLPIFWRLHLGPTPLGSSVLPLSLFLSSDPFQHRTSCHSFVALSVPPHPFILFFSVSYYKLAFRFFRALATLSSRVPPCAGPCTGLHTDFCLRVFLSKQIEFPCFSSYQFFSFFRLAVVHFVPLSFEVAPRQALTSCSLATSLPP